jgi:hypothetical protein
MVGGATERSLSPTLTVEETVPETAQQATVTGQPRALTEERRSERSATTRTGEPVVAQAFLEAVEIEGVMPKAEVLEGAASGLEVPIAPVTTEEVRDDALPESSMDVVVRLPEIQDTKPIRSVSMSEAAMTSRGGLELQADDLINPAMVARNLEPMCRAE